MRVSERQIAMIATLQDLMEEMCADDLTLPRARILRQQLFALSHEGHESVANEHLTFERSNPIRKIDETSEEDRESASRSK